MPFYLLTVFDDEGCPSDTPFESDNDTEAEMDALVYASCLSNVFAGIHALRVTTLEIGRINHRSGMIHTSQSRSLLDTRSDKRDEDDEDLSPNVLGAARRDRDIIPFAVAAEIASGRHFALRDDDHRAS